MIVFAWHSLALLFKLAIGILIAAIGGDLIVFFLKKLLVSPRLAFSFNISGIIERLLIMVAILAGGIFSLLIPVIVAIRAYIILGEGNFKKVADIIRREEPAVEFQKIRLKSEIGIEIFSSPILGILSGILIKIL